MLVLTRKTSEQIQIGDRVVITILRVKGQSVRIGIDAPRDVLVLRGELPKFASSEDGPSKPEGQKYEIESRKYKVGRRDPDQGGKAGMRSMRSLSYKLSTQVPSGGGYGSNRITSAHEEIRTARYSARGAFALRTQR